MAQLKGEALPDQIAQWKDQYGKVFKYEADDMVCYFRPVDRNTYSVAASKVSTSPAKFNEIIIEKIWLGGAEELRKEDRYFFGLIEHVEELLGKVKGSLGEC